METTIMENLMETAHLSQIRIGAHRTPSPICIRGLLNKKRFRMFHMVGFGYPDAASLAVSMQPGRNLEF